MLEEGDDAAAAGVEQLMSEHATYDANRYGSSGLERHDSGKRLLRIPRKTLTAACLLLEKHQIEFDYLA
jgi:hypothetical protein